MFVCHTLFNDVFRRGIHTKQCTKQPRLIRNNQMFVATLYIKLIWNKPETNSWKWKHVVIFSLNPFRPRWHRCPWTFHRLRLGLCWWTTEFGFSTLGLQKFVVNEGTNSKTKTLDSTTKVLQQPKKSTSNRFSFLVVESDLDCKLRIIYHELCG